MQNLKLATQWYIPGPI